MFRNWVSQMFRPRRQFPITKTTKPSKNRTRLLLEALEDRLAPATLTVNSTVDDATINNVAGRVTLRDAIVDSETQTATNLGDTPTGNDTIVFDPSVQGATFNLLYDSTQQLVLGFNGTFGASAFYIWSDLGAENLTIQGTGETINAGGLFRIFQTGTNASLTLSDLTLQNGKAQGGDGAPAAGGAAGMGGAIFNQGILNATNVTFSNNVAQGGAGQAGNFIDFGGGGGAGGPGIASTTVTSANGGPAFPGGPTAPGSLTTGTSGDFGQGGGDGLDTGGNGGYGGGGGQSSTTGVGGNGGFGGGGGAGLFEGSGGFGGGTANGINAGGGAGMGGAIFNVGGQNGGGAATATITNCTFFGNKAFGGAGGDGTPTTAGQGLGGAIFSDNANLNLLFDTIDGNFSSTVNGGGVYATTGGVLRTQNTIFAQNGNAAPLANGIDMTVSPGVTFTDNGNNLIGDPTGLATVSSDVVGTHVNPLNPLLAPLANYGLAGSLVSPLFTMAELPGSPALDAGAPTTTLTDERGFTRLNSSGDPPDIGAFESAGFTTAIVSGNNQSALPGNGFADPLVVSVTSNDATNDPVVNGGVVTFTAPASEPTAHPTVQMATIGAMTSGQAQVSEIAGTGGPSYTVSANTAPVNAAENTGASFTLTNAVPTSASFSTQPTDTAEGGIINSGTGVQVTVLDQIGNPLPGVPVTLTLTTGPGTLTGAGPVTTNSSGIAVFSSVSINEEGNSDQLTATAGTSPNTAVQTSNPFNITEVQITNLTGAGASPTVIEGGTVPGFSVATFTDPAGAEPNAGDPSGTANDHYTTLIHWGDGTTSSGNVVNTSGNNFRIDGPTHTYGEEGSYTVTVDVTHETAATLTVTAATVTVTEVQITNLAGAGGSHNVNEGGTTTAITGIATFTDPAGAEPNASDSSGTANDHYTTLIHWGDGTTSPGNVVNTGGNSFRIDAPTHSYDSAVEEGTSYTVTVDVTHETAATLTVTGTTIHVVDAPLTDATPHEAYGNPSGSIVEGNSTGSILVGRFIDANPVSSASDFPPNDVIIHWGDGSTSQGTVQLNSSDASSTTWDIFGSNTYVDAGLFTVTVHVMDVGGSTVTTGMTAGPVTVNVADGVLTDVTAANTINAVEGNATPATTVVATFTDSNPNATAADYTAGGGSTVINWGDGGPTSVATPAQLQFVSNLGGVSTWNVLGSHVYMEKGNFNVSVKITDDDGNTVTTGQTTLTTVTFAVADAALTDTTPGQTFNVSEGNSTTQYVATFTDNNPLATAADFPNANLVINWGDSGPTSQGSVFTNGAPTSTQSFWRVQGTHTYLEPGTYNVSVTITDVDGNSITTAAVTVFVVFDATLTDATQQTTIIATEGNSTADPSFTTDLLGNQVVAIFRDNNPIAPITDFQSTPPMITWGDGSLATPGTVQLVSRNASFSTWEVLGAHTYAEVTGSPFHISVTITDVDGSILITPTAGTHQVSVNVVDAPLFDATIPQILSAVEGNDTGTQVVATFNDFNPSAPPNDFPDANLIINWGDGGPTSNGTIQFVSSNGIFSTWEVLGHHVYMEPGQFNVSVRITDVDGFVLPTTSGTQFRVVDASLTDVTPGTTTNACANKPADIVNQVVATFQDANPFATTADFPSNLAHLAIDWGDGTTPSVGLATMVGGGFPLPFTTFEVLGSHTYAHAGVFNVSVHIMDVDGATLITPSSGFNVVTFNVSPNHLKFTTIPSTVVSGHKFTVVVTGYDSLDDSQVSTKYFGPIFLSITPGTGPVGGHLGGITTVNAVAGVATFTNLTLDRATPPQYFLRAADPCGDFVDSPTGIEVTASAIIVSSSAIPMPNVYFPVTFTAVDVTGHVATNYVGPAILTVTQTPLYGRLSVLGGPQLVAIGHSLGSYPFVNGVLTVNLKSNKPGTFTVKWVAAGGFSGSFSWSYGRRLTFISNRIVTM